MPELRVRYPDIPEPVALPPEQERHYLLRGVSEFLERAARATPLVLIFEDLHWADESTLLLVQHMAQRLAQMPVLMLGTYRDTELKPGRPLAGVLPSLLRQRLAEEIVLRRLTEEGVAALLEGRAGSKPPAELVALVYSENRGQSVLRRGSSGISTKRRSSSTRKGSGAQACRSPTPRCRAVSAW